jgi:hypothetical protein
VVSAAWISQDPIKIRTTVLKLTDKGTWDLCWDSGTFKNPSEDHYMIMVLQADGRAPCGAGYYRTKGHAYILQNGRWQGGPLVITVNERHYLPCREGAQC